MYMFQFKYLVRIERYQVYLFLTRCLIINFSTNFRFKNILVIKSCMVCIIYISIELFHDNRPNEE